MPASSFTPEIAETVCARLAEGESLRAICRDEAMPSYRTVFSWLAANEEFRASYAQAREVQADAIFEDVLEIADDGRNDWMAKQDGSTALDGEHVQRSRLRIDARKWVLARMAPKKYGDRLDLNHSGGIGVEAQPDLSDLSRDERTVIKELLLKSQALKRARLEAQGESDAA